MQETLVHRDGAPLTNDPPPPRNSATADALSHLAELETRHIPVGDFIPFVNQSREHFDEDELANLARDIKQNGLLQPGVAWLDPARDKWILIAGERRLRASKIAGLPTMAVKLIHGPLSQAQMLAINLAENIQRASLNPIERAKAFRRLAQLENISSRQVAERMHLSDATVSRELTLLELDDELQGKVATGAISASVGYLIARLPNDATRRDVAEQVMAGKLSRARVEHIVKGRPGKKTGSGRPARLAVTLDGASLTVLFKQPLSNDTLNRLVEQLKKEAKKLQDRVAKESAAPSITVA